MAKYPQEVRDYILANYKGTGHKEMALRLKEFFNYDCTADKIKSFYGNNKLNSGLNGRFEKGNISHNKGRKGHCSPGCEKGWFVKGGNPHNYKPVGSERVTVDGYVEIKVNEPRTWKLKHRVIWEQVYGAIPQNSILIFLNGNKEDLRIENLALITRSEHARLNQSKLRFDNTQLTEAGVLIVRINNKVREKRKNKNLSPLHQDNG